MNYYNLDDESNRIEVELETEKCAVSEIPNQKIPKKCNSSSPLNLIEFFFRWLCAWIKSIFAKCRFYPRDKLKRVGPWWNPLGEIISCTWQHRGIITSTVRHKWNDNAIPNQLELQFTLIWFQSFGTRKSHMLYLCMHCHQSQTRVSWHKENTKETAT